MFFSSDELIVEHDGAHGGLEFSFVLLSESKTIGEFLGQASVLLSFVAVGEREKVSRKEDGNRDELTPRRNEVRIVAIFWSVVCPVRVVDGQRDNRFAKYRSELESLDIETRRR